MDVYVVGRMKKTVVSKARIGRVFGSVSMISNGSGASCEVVRREEENGWEDRPNGSEIAKKRKKILVQKT